MLDTILRAVDRLSRSGIDFFLRLEKTVCAGVLDDTAGCV